MDPASLKPWLDIFVSYGLPTIITVLVLALAVKYVPKWIDASIKYQSEMPKELAGLTSSLNKLGLAMITVEAHTGKHKGEMRILRRGFSLAIRAAISASKNFKIPSDVIKDLNRAQNAVEMGSNSSDEHDDESDREHRRDRPRLQDSSELMP